MPAFQVEKSIEIAATVDKTRNAIENFHAWPHWSPWLCAEPDARIEYQGEIGQPGHRYDWDGQIVGAGGMELSSNQNNRLLMDLSFLRPFKSEAKVEFKLQEVENNRTQVSWSMDSKLPFFMFFLKKMFTGMIGNDYRRGLLLLKEYVETGNTTSSTEVPGVQQVPAVDYIGTTTNCSMEEMGDSMGESLTRLQRHLSDNDITVAGQPLSIYNKFKMDFSNCNYTAALPVTAGSTPPHLASGEFHQGRTTSCQALKVVHKGSYRHLGNAWSTAFMHQKALKLKKSKIQQPYEIYVSDPEKTPEADLITEIYIPVR